MIVAHYRFPRGARIVIPLGFHADASERAADIGVTAWLLYSGARPTEVTADMEKVADFTIEERGQNKGWFLTIEESDDLAVGFHLTAIRATSEDSSDTSDRIALVEITQPVTGV
jgi:hypothetical protein